MKTRCTKIKLKRGCVEHARAWAAEINGRSDEALATLRDEGVVMEAAFLDQTSEGDFLIYFMRAEDFDQAGTRAKSSGHAIDAFHKQFQGDCWEDGTKLERLIDLAIELP